MRRLTYLANARRDLGDIADVHLDRGASPETVRRFIALMDEQCVRLAANPATLGRIREEFGRELRSFPCRKYLIFFRYRGSVLEIVRIVHGARDLPRLFDAFDEEGD